MGAIGYAHEVSHAGIGGSSAASRTSALRAWLC